MSDIYKGEMTMIPQANFVPMFVFKRWADGAADCVIAGHNPNDWPAWRCWLLNACGTTWRFIWSWWWVEWR
jgi:hypothetical protein